MAETGNAVRVDDAQADSRYINAMGDSRSELAIPLIANDRTIGVLDVQSHAPGHFNDCHQRILTFLAGHLANAIENARLYENLREQTRSLSLLHEAGRELTSILELEPVMGKMAELVKRLVDYHVFTLMLWGDFYDFLPYGDGRLAIAVGDVAGKAAAAALQGSLAVGTLREHVVSHPCDPAEMLGHMNHRLEQPRLDNRFVAMTFAVYDANDRSLTVANAGFPRPQLLRDGSVEEVPVPGLPLGILPGQHYEQRTLGLREGDVIVFCSDGLQECVDSHGDEFGSERLESLLVRLASSTAQEIADALLDATTTHAGAGGEPQDDRTVVVLKVGRV